MMSNKKIKKFFKQFNFKNNDFFKIRIVRIIRKIRFTRIRKFLMYLCRIFVGRIEFKRFFNIKDKNIVFVYDARTASNRYGDLTYFCMLAKIIIFRSHTTKIIFLKNDKNNLNDVDSEQLIIVIKKILNNYKYDFEILDDRKFFNRYRNNKNILFKTFLVEKLPSYIYYYELILRFNKLEPVERDPNFFIQKKSFKLDKNSSNYPFLDNKFITFVCRYTGGKESVRDISKSEFLQIRNYLFNNFKNIPIILVSDNLGCNYYKSLEPNDKFKLFYSKDINKNDSFLDDAYLLVSSSLIFQLRGGGIILPAIFSKTPYLLFANKLGVERRVSFNKLTPWSKSINQYFYYLDYWDSSIISKLTKIFKDILFG